MQNSKITYFRILSLEIVSASFYCSSSEGEKCREVRPCEKGVMSDRSVKRALEAFWITEGRVFLFHPQYKYASSGVTIEQYEELAPKEKSSLKTFDTNSESRRHFLCASQFWLGSKKYYIFSMKTEEMEEKEAVKYIILNDFSHAMFHIRLECLFHLTTSLRILTRMCFIWLRLSIGCVEIP